MKKSSLLFGMCAATTMTLLLGCSNEGGESKESKYTEVPNIYDIKLGEEYTDISASIKWLTHRTDLVEDGTFDSYVSAFNEMYPNIKIEMEGATDYAESITTRLTTDNWGTLCMIPTTIDKDELPGLFVSYGDLTELDKVYNFNNNFSYDGQVYGIASVGNAQGIVYNKAVFEEAGITETPTTPDQFLDALQQVKDNTDAIPLYTNFAAGWTMTAWDAYIGGSATGDPDYTNTKVVHGSNPFSKHEDMTGPYAVYYVLYEAVARGLIEDDPTTTDWEGSKGMINNGDIATMVLGSWSIVQMQESGSNPDDIGYMSFPITVDGKQYATAGPDYTFGINVNSSIDEQIAAMVFVKWFTEQSGYAVAQGGIPIDKSLDYPEVLSAFDGIEYVVDNPAPEGEETLFNDLNNYSELGLNSDPTKLNNIVESALSGDKTLDEIMDEWNAKWTQAQEKYEVEITE